MIKLFRKTLKFQNIIMAKVNTIIHIFIALALVSLGKFEEALKENDLAIQKNPENSKYYHGKGK